MERDALYKVFAGHFYMLDENGESTEDYKDKDLFRNTYGLVFLIHAATNGRCYALYFARDDHDWNFRTVFPVGKLVEEGTHVCIKTRYNSYVWDSAMIEQEKIEDLYKWVKMNGETYIPGLKNHKGVKEYFKQGRHFRGDEKR